MQENIYVTDLFVRVELKDVHRVHYKQRVPELVALFHFQSRRIPSRVDNRGEASLITAGSPMYMA